MSVRPRQGIRALRPQTTRWTLIAGGAAFALAFMMTSALNVFRAQLPVVRAAEFAEGTIANRDVIASRDLRFVDEEATERVREARAGLVAPVFRVREEVTSQARADFDRFTELLVNAHETGTGAEAVVLQVRAELESTIVDAPLIEALLVSEDPTAITASARRLLDEVMTGGIVAIPENLGSTALDAVELWRWTDGRLFRETLPLDRLVTADRLDPWIRSRIDAGLLSALTERDASIVEVIAGLVDTFAEPNAFFDPDETARQRQVARNAVEPVTARVLEGQIVVRQGQVISEEQAVMINALSVYGSRRRVANIEGNALYFIFLYLLSLTVFSRSVLGRGLERKYVIFLIALAVIYVGLTAAVVNAPRAQGWPPVSVYLPAGAIGMIVAIIISTRAGIFFSLLLSLIELVVLDLDIYAFLFTFLSAVAGAAIVSSAERRIDLVRAGLALAAFCGLVAASLTLLYPSDELAIVNAVSWGVVNGFGCGILALGFLPIFEHLLNAPTRFRLMELSDLNAPILKRMLMHAPGTYSHSISVANLAESACTEIGANPLLARVGAYYHDIGKIDQAEYFVENQRDKNIHDELKPSLSAAVIRSHVKIGIEKARELGLPREVVDIVAQHHGKSLITFFYQRAVEEYRKEHAGGTDGEDKNGGIAKSDFRYPGQRPRTREAAVVMLADTVEAALRSFKKPSVTNLEKSIWKLIVDRFDTGELSECDLTFRDLDTIKNSFTQIFAGYFHTRVEYPETDEAPRASVRAQ